MRDITTWFCDAYASWQKGGVENGNGWLPRHLDIDRTSDRDIQEIVLATNLTPVNASGSRRHSKPCLPSLERMFKSASHNLVALRSGIQGAAKLARPVAQQGFDDLLGVSLASARPQVG